MCACISVSACFNEYVCMLNKMTIAVTSHRLLLRQKTSKITDLSPRRRILSQSHDDLLAIKLPVGVGGGGHVCRCLKS